jgi:hypothetical protein
MPCCMKALVGHERAVMDILLFQCIAYILYVLILLDKQVNVTFIMECKLI